MTLLIIENHALPAHARSDASDPHDRAEEDLIFGARDTLEDLRLAPIPAQFRERGIDTWQTWLLFCAPHVAKHFAVDKDQLLTEWVKHYNPFLHALLWAHSRR